MMITYKLRCFFLLSFLLITNTVFMSGEYSALFEKINKDLEYQASHTNNFLQTIYTEIETLKKQSPAPFHIPDNAPIQAFEITPQNAPLLFRCLVENSWQLGTAINIEHIRLYLYTPEPNKPGNDYRESCYNCRVFFTNGNKPFITLSENFIKLFLQPSLRNYFFALLAHELGHFFHKHTEATPSHEFTADEFACTLLQNPAPLIKAIAIRDFADFLSLALQIIYKKKLSVTELDARTTLQLSEITEKTTCSIFTTTINLKSLLSASTDIANLVCVYEIVNIIFANLSTAQLLQKSTEEMVQLLSQQFVAIFEDKKQTVLKLITTTPAYIAATKETNETHPPFIQRAAHLERMQFKKSSDLCEGLF